MFPVTFPRNSARKHRKFPVTFPPGRSWARKHPKFPVTFPRSSAIETEVDGCLVRKPICKPSYMIDIKGFDDDDDEYKCFSDSEMTEMNKISMKALAILALKSYQEYFDEEYYFNCLGKVAVRNGRVGGGGDHYITFTALKNNGYGQVSHTVQAVVTKFGITAFVLYVKII